MNFSKSFFFKFFQDYCQSVKKFGSRSGRAFCQARSGSKTVCKGFQQTTLIGKELRGVLIKTLSDTIDALTQATR